MMRDMFSLIEKVVPQVGQELVQRLRIMKTLAQHPERIGRKTLAEEVALSERSLRTLMDSLRSQGLVDVKQSGIRLTPIGLDVLEAMEQALDDHHEFFELAQGVKEKLGLQEVWIVKGDADIDPKVGSRLGRKVAEFLALNLESERQVLAMTGGTTLAQVAQELGYDYFGSALTLSPKKNSQLINELGLEVQQLYDVNYLPSDFKKNKGYERSIVMCREYDVYRQCYCGCVFAAKQQGVDLREVNKEALAYLKDKHENWDKISFNFGRGEAKEAKENHD